MPPCAQSQTTRLYRENTDLWRYMPRLKPARISPTYAATPVRYHRSAAIMPLSHHAQLLPNNAANRTGSTNVRLPTCRWRPGFSHWPRSRTDPYLPAGSYSKTRPCSSTRLLLLPPLGMASSPSSPSLCHCDGQPRTIAYRAPNGTPVGTAHRSSTGTVDVPVGLGIGRLHPSSNRLPNRA